MADTSHKDHRRAWGTALIALLLVGIIILLKSGFFDQYEFLVPYKNLQLYVYPLTVIFFTVVVAKLVSQFLHELLIKRTKHLLVVERTRYTLFAKLITAVIYLLGIGIAISLIPGLRQASIALFGSATVLTVIIGFALQKPLGNLMSGLMIAVYQPYRIGDRVRWGDEYGAVEDITLRHTILKMWDNKRVIVPNSKMDEEVIQNYTIEDPRILGWVDVDISYDSDIDLARQIMQEEVLNHHDFLDNRTEEEMLATEEAIKVRVVELGEYFVRLRAYFWTSDQVTKFRMGCDLMESIKKRFDAEGVEIPFPYKTITYKKDMRKPKRVKRHK